MERRVLKVILHGVRQEEGGQHPQMVVEQVTPHPPRRRRRHSKFLYSKRDCLACR